MPGVNAKEQLGVRVNPGVRQRCVDAATLMGVSLNEWVETVLLRALQGTPVTEPLDGQVTLDEVLPEQRTGKKFASDCSMRTYHWKCSPGDPCRRCGGETE